MSDGPTETSTGGRATGPAGGPTAPEIAEFARVFAALSGEVHRLLPPTNEIADRARSHLGVEPAELPSVGLALPPVERPNLQLALDDLLAVTTGDADRADQAQQSRQSDRSEPTDPVVIGLSPQVAHYPDFSFAALLGGRFTGPSQAVPPTYEHIPTGVDRSLRCVNAGLWFLDHDGEPAIVGLLPSEQHGPGQGSLRLEVFAAGLDTAQAVMDRLTDLRHRHNVYRGQVLGFSHGQYGDFGIRFLERPAVTAADVILPDGHLTSIERHAIGIGGWGAELTAKGQHLRRGLLLYGPPGTGKTHTIGYLMQAMPERTAVVLQGPSVGALGQAAAIVRSLTPAMLVIEDVDLIAGERFMGGFEGTNPLMFQLLNEMDGLTPSDDVLFVLTTNRVEVLESALAARPGRIDHAVEIGRPDREGRARLLRLYLAPTGHRVEDLEPIVAATEGVTASFIKELVRRAVHLTLDRGRVAVDDELLAAALAELVDGSVPAVRAMLGAPTPAGVSAGSDPSSTSWTDDPAGPSPELPDHGAEPWT